MSLLLRVDIQRKKRTNSLLDLRRSSERNLEFEFPYYVTIHGKGLSISGSIEQISSKDLQESKFIDHIGRGGQGWVDLIEYKGIRLAKKTMVGDSGITDLRLIENELEAFRREVSCLCLLLLSLYSV